MPVIEQLTIFPARCAEGAVPLAPGVEARGARCGLVLGTAWISNILGYRLPVPQPDLSKIGQTVAAASAGVLPGSQDALM